MRLADNLKRLPQIRNPCQKRFVPHRTIDHHLSSKHHDFTTSLGVLSMNRDLATPAQHDERLLKSTQDGKMPSIGAAEWFVGGQEMGEDSMTMRCRLGKGAMELINLFTTRFIEGTDQRIWLELELGIEVSTRLLKRSLIPEFLHLRDTLTHIFDFSIGSSSFGHTTDRIYTNR